jgi:hypothetical protein
MLKGNIAMFCSSVDNLYRGIILLNTDTAFVVPCSPLRFPIAT